MVLYNNGLIKLHYDASNDILCAECPDIQDFTLVQIHDTFKRISATIGGYGIKKLLFDCSKAVIDVSDEEYITVIDEFDRDLQDTCLKRMARIISPDLEREIRVASYFEALKKRNKKSAIAFQNFSSMTAAMKWLKS
ncbi:hypothetical protein [Botryobacter ruber]|uniref:hypothetical protein n=1 Tax=Botryobacter ruber TaxID=2171629 RepID=UPI000E0A5475|nr:hypothetical protein [Botryobacter ruber]